MNAVSVVRESGEDFRERVVLLEFRPRGDGLHARAAQVPVPDRVSLSAVLRVPERRPRQPRHLPGRPGALGVTTLSLSWLFLQLGRGIVNSVGRTRL